MINRAFWLLAPAIASSLLLGCSANEPESVKTEQGSSALEKNESGAVPKPIWEGGAQKDVKASYRKAMSAGWALKNPAIPEAETRCSASATPAYHIRYVTRYPENVNGDPTLPYTDIVPPPTSLNGATYRIPMVKDVVVWGNFTWSRSYKATIWDGVDEVWKAERMAEIKRIDDEGREFQDSDPSRYVAAIREMAQIMNQIRTNPVMGTNEDIWHSVEVEAPPTHWSFKYNAETRKGDALYRREDMQHLNRLAQVLADNPAARDQFTQPIRDINVQTPGTRTILGHVCDVRAKPGWKSKACFMDIDGEAVSLASTLDKAERQAVFLDLDPCIPPGFFNPPSTVDFDEDW